MWKLDDELIRSSLQKLDQEEARIREILGNMEQFAKRDRWMVKARYTRSLEQIAVRQRMLKSWLKD